MSLLIRCIFAVIAITTPALADQDPLIATSELVKMASVAALHDGYDVTDPNIYLDEVKGPDGPDPTEGYMSIGLYKDIHPLAIYSVRIATGDVINTFTCTLYRYPDMMAFRQRQIASTESRPVDPVEIKDELGCLDFKIVPSSKKHASR